MRLSPGGGVGRSGLIPWLVGMVGELGRGTREPLRASGFVLILLGKCLTTLLVGGSDGQRISMASVTRRVAEMGPLAIGLTARFGLSIGLVFGLFLEDWLQLADLLDVAVGEATAVMVEQVAPLFVAIMFAAHSGAALAADLGSMVAAKEIDALRSLGLSPDRILVAPAILGALIVLPVLTILMIACILLTFAVYLQLIQISSVPMVVSLALNAMEPAALATALAKGALFGPLIVAIAAGQGLTEQPITRRVGYGVSNAAVTMISTILLLNALISLTF